MARFKFDPKAAIDCTCPGCGHGFQKTLKELQAEFQCPGCGVKFVPDNVGPGIQAAENAIEDFKRNLRRALR